MKIIHTPDFDLDIIEIKNYLKENHPTYIKSTLLQIKQKTKDLAKNPYMGRIGRDMGTREVVFTKLPYVIIYKIKENELHILDIFHTSRNYPLQ
ncbi:MAG: type II toxin-antitoxin system RelE/ParE family toxin [Alphaproteobacteria bacterium]|jgi:plasmid stabilization system protein ParE|nr:type II toxin-antitoxin system RelE/ParE family toxin [Alphaproteobacteria bacterium]